VRWVSRLKQENLIASSHFRFQTASVKYGDKDFFADDVFGDSLSFNAGLLTSLGSDWVNRIVGEIELTEKLVRQAGYLAQNLALAAGNADGSGARSIAREQAYFRLDIPFRRWLEGIDPERGSMNTVCDQWWQQEVGIVRALGRELVTQAGPQAFVGRDGHATPNEYNRFLYYTSSRQLLEAAGKKERR
jgi:CRISPR system Cascade subunit CasA